MGDHINELIATYYDELNRIGPMLDEVYTEYKDGFEASANGFPIDCDWNYAYDVGVEHGALDAEYHTLVRVINDLKKMRE